MKRVVYIRAEDISDSILKEKFSFKIGQLIVGSIPKSINPKLPTLIDNKAYSGKTLSLYDVFKLYEQALNMLENFKVVIPDYVEDYVETSKMYDEALREILRNNYDLSKFVFVIQGRTVDEYLICLKYLIHTFKKYRYKGASIRNVTIGVGGVKAKPVHIRPKITYNVLLSVRSLLPKIKIHLFGGDLRTIETCWGFVNSIDLTTYAHRINSQIGFKVIITKDSGKIYESRIYIKDLEEESRIDYDALMIHNLREYLRAIDIRVRRIDNQKFE